MSSHYAVHPKLMLRSVSIMSIKVEKEISWVGELAGTKKKNKETFCRH